jgi:hypothetical protein
MLSTSVKSVLDIQRKRTMREKIVKDKILSSAKEKINNYAMHGQMRCSFQVPIFLLGHAPYNDVEMIVHIASTLMKEGFYVEVNNANILISWNAKDIQKVQKHKKKEKDSMTSLVGMMNLKK